MSSLHIDYHKITPPMLEKAMIHFGWSKIKTFPNNIAVWSSDLEGIKQWVPLDDNFDDYYQVVQETINSLAKTANTSDKDVDLYLNQFFCNKDLVRLRVVADDIVDGAIDFADGINVFPALNQLIKGAFESVAGATKGMKKNLETSFFKKCELSQTEEGSYIVNAYLPVFIEAAHKDSQHQLDEIGSVNFGRQVNTALMNRLIYLKEQLVDYSSDNAIEIVKKLLSQGFSKKECSAIVGLFGAQGNRNWEVSVIWSEIEQVPPEQHSFVAFEHSSLQCVRELSNKFKFVETQEDTCLLGRVVSLNKDYGEACGTVSFKTKIDDKEVTVKVKLDSKQYNEAVVAHETEEYIDITGELLITDKDNGSKVSYELIKVESIQPKNLSLDL